MTTKIGIIGDGNVGSALARGLVRGGHEVRAIGKAGRLGDKPLTAFVAADDASARKTVLELARTIGFDALDAGPLKNARLLEPLALFNIQLGYAFGMGAQIGFKLLHG